MAVRRSAFMAVCGFDERFGPGTPIGGGEEADLVVRLAVEGGRCVLADAPPVQHRAWRDAAADRANVTVYQRAAGAWVGAALRRAPVRSAKVAALRVRHELGWWRDPGHRGWTLGPRLSGAFLAGLATGVTLAPRRHRP
jgi:GT2 family glycosyltransferase